MPLAYDRRRFIRTSAVLGTGGLAGLVGRAQDRPPSPIVDPNLITQETQSAIDKGLQYLASTQAADGSFPDTRTGFGNVAITGLAGLALMAGGNQPSRGKYAKHVARAADYVADRGARASKTGYLNNALDVLSHGGMYQHGFGALFLSEIHGMIPDPARQRRIRDVLAKAVELTVTAQNTDGGWRYDPQPVVQADVSVTVAQLMALRAARNAGLFVPKSAADKAVAYIKACQTEDGGFCYIKGQGYSGSAFAR
jgi:prenyltransferase beta subunit